MEIKKSPVVACPLVKIVASESGEAGDSFCQFSKFPPPPPSKYSSTETESELSSDHYDDDQYDHRAPIRRDSTTGIHALSGLSTSTSSSSLRGRKRQRTRNWRKHKIPEQDFYLCPSSHRFSNENRDFRSRRRKSKWWEGRFRKFSGVPVLNSIYDLEHATGRHRGISGSSAPAIDSVLFAMFYATDVFDSLLSSNSLEITRVNGRGDSDARSPTADYVIRREILGVLRKEIVYSLRTSYFCPSAKIMKLVGLLEDQFPLEGVRDPSNFINILLSQILDHPPFLNYSSSNYEYILHVEVSAHESGYFAPSRFVTSVQDLMRKQFSSSSTIRGRTKFTTIPQPALIIKLNRGRHAGEVRTRNPSDLRSTSSCANHRYHHHYSVIPSLTLDLADLISREIRGENFTRRNSSSGLGQQSLLASTSFSLSPSSSVSTRPSLDHSAGGESRPGSEIMETGRGPKQRLMKGLKSAMSTVFRYLEDFASSPSTHFPGSENSFIHNYNGSQGTTSPLSSSASNFLGNSNSYAQVKDNHYLLEGESLRSASSSSPFSFTSSVLSRSHPRHQTSNNNGLEDEIGSNVSGPTTTATTSSASSFSFGSRLWRRGKARQSFPASSPTKMKLIAIICKSTGAGRAGEDVCECCCGESYKTARDGVGYSVYCKAQVSPSTSDSENDEEKIEKEFVPWILYQSTSGVAPQVTLIENLGKWINCLELRQGRNQENHLNFSQIPVEIKRILEYSELLIYKLSED